MTKTATKTEDRPLLQRALSAIPQYDELGRAVDALAAHAAAVAEQATKGDPLAELRADVRRAVLAGDSPPADLGARLIEAEARERARDTELELIGRKIGRYSSTGMIGDLIEERQLLVTHEAERAFAVLAAELDEILTAVRDVDATLGGVQTMEAAVRAGDSQAAAWRDLLRLVDAYDALRLAQQALVVQGLGREADASGVWPLLEDAGFIANLVDLDPVWQFRKTPPTTADPGGHDPLAPTGPPEWIVLKESPWPAPQLTRGGRHWPTDNQPSYLRWLVSGEPDVWLPAMPALRAKQAEMTAPPTSGSGPSGPSKAEKRFDRKLERDRRYHASIAADEEERQRTAAGRDCDWR